MRGKQFGVVFSFLFPFCAGGTWHTCWWRSGQGVENDCLSILLLLVQTRLGTPTQEDFDDSSGQHLLRLSGLGNTCSPSYGMLGMKEKGGHIGGRAIIAGGGQYEQCVL
ncbi:uncharacterized protein LY79DRAFT_546835 [Colletotrichum navitas]|uniref:Secreted protein n=1 Tax=Colletotrichum navitas TaxID=681940 RepID=A0AAD8Q6J2_9PEZI|nr:uncharacterized protein LY79DRAFT_546835 [Colletotrichum navitas]KAK1595589.1 hypothetical protein LY79DRAFT_546835 [Colletotrichum navitas]